jgi:hypothetical protein
VSNCAFLEQAISYLEWQLLAFAWNAQHPSAAQAERQTATRAREWDKFANLEARLRRVTRAFEDPEVSSRINQMDAIREMRRERESLRERARDLGKQRKDVGHSFISYGAGNVLRQFGRVWNEQKFVSTAQDDCIGALGKLATEIATYATELGRVLPFADDDQIHAEGGCPICIRTGIGLSFCLSLCAPRIRISNSWRKGSDETRRRAVAG